ncbi:MAG: MgtC/SapB family protein [Gammaproteobacteria bacterium]
MLKTLAKIGAAYVIALPVAINRESDAGHNAGLRTFPLVATAACGYMVLGIQVLDTTEAEARVLYGIITGMGFIGGGSILKNESGVSGTATAASLWITGAIGLAVAYNRFEIAIALSLITYLTLLIVPTFKNSAFK